MVEARQFFREEPVLLTLVRGSPDVLDRVKPRFDPSPPLYVVVDKFESVEYLEEVYAILKRAGCLKGSRSDVDSLDAFGDTPFSVAAFAGRIQTFGTWLRDRGADINHGLRCWFDRRRSILNALCQTGQYNDAMLLMDMGADIHRDAALNRAGHSHGEHESIVHLCRGFRGCMMGWPVEDRARTQREAMALLKRLIHAGADVNVKAVGSWTPLMSAARHDFPPAVLLLLEAKPDLRAEDDAGHTALHNAVAHGLGAFPGAQLRSALTIIQLLLDAGADPNQQSEGMSDPPLFQGDYAAEVPPGVEARKFTSDRSRERVPNNMASIAPLLIKPGADPNMYIDEHRDLEAPLAVEVASLQGHSLPLTAFFNGEYDSLDSLLACGTLVPYEDYLLMMKSLINLQFRSKGSTSSSVQALFRILNSPSLRLEQPEHGESIMDAWTEIFIDSVGCRPNLAHLLAPHFSLTDKLGYGGRTALHVLAQWERKRGELKTVFQHRINKMMAALMRCGAHRQINQPDHNGRSPLYNAVSRGNVAVARALVRAGASLHVEPRRQDGTIVDSPLRLAIKGYSEASWYQMADTLLDTFLSKWDRKQDRYCESAGLLKDLILHFRDHPLDKPFHVAARTNKLLVKLLDLGVDVKEPDEDGNTLLHLLVQLLYPVAKDAKRTKASEKSKRYSRDESEDVAEALAVEDEGSDPQSVFYIQNQSYVHMDGVNLHYPSDSDFGNAGSGRPERDDDASADEHGYPFLGGPQPDDDLSDDDADYTDDDSSSDDDNHDSADDNSMAGDFLQPNSMRVMARKDYKGDRPRHKPRGLAKRGRARKLDRADAWILSFYIILSESKGDSLLMKNNAGETPLDLIRGLKDCRVRECPKVYRRIINALGRFDMEDPLSSELLNKLNGSSVIPKKKAPFFFVFNRKGCYLIVPRPEGIRRVECRGRARQKWYWVPFW